MCITDWFMAIIGYQTEAQFLKYINI